MQSTETLPNGLTLFQDDRFFKLGQDSVLLSAFARIPRRARVLDLGCGTGALALLCWRDDLTITGLELQPGDCQVVPPTQQGEGARAAAKVEHPGAPGDAGEGREQDRILAELEKAVILEKRQPIGQGFCGLHRAPPCARASPGPAVCRMRRSRCFCRMGGALQLFFMITEMDCPVKLCRIVFDKRTKYR